MDDDSCLDGFSLEPLIRREKEILQPLPERLTNSEIAQSLSISF
jgi:hypothetical protein